MHSFSSFDTPSKKSCRHWPSQSNLISRYHDRQQTITEIAYTVYHLNSKTCVKDHERFVKIKEYVNEQPYFCVVIAYSCAVMGVILEIHFQSILIHNTF